MLSNPNYHQWKLVDQYLSAALSTTISPSLLPYILSLDTTVAVWDTLTMRLQATNRSRVIQLKNKLHRVSLNNNTINQYLSEVKALVDQISAAGSNVGIKDIILYILYGLPSSYQAFKTAIHVRAGSLSLDELYSLLVSQEVTINSEIIKEYPQAPISLYSSRSRGRSYPNRACAHYSAPQHTANDPRPPAAPGSSSRPPPRCQICSKLGHTTTTCWHHTNLAYIPTPRQPPHAAYLAQTGPTEPDWVLDTGASSNLTSNLNQLQLSEPYQGSDTISIGNS